MVVTAVVAASAVSAYSGYKQRQQQKKMQQESLAAQERANVEARKLRKEANERQEIAQNKANRRKANVDAISQKEKDAALSGPAGTMLTGTQGVDPNQLNLGGNTLLGG